MEYLPKFLDAGYDLPFIYKFGLKFEDLECVGIPVKKLGLRRKLIALHRLDEFYDKYVDDSSSGSSHDGSEFEENYSDNS